MNNRSRCLGFRALCILAGCLAATASFAQTTGDRQLYRIGVEDVLDVNVWKNPDVSRQVWVRPDGRITLPLVGEVVAESLTPLELTEMLSSRLKEFFTDPVVTVTVTEVNSYNVYLLGRVASPGVVALKSPRTFLQVLAMVGGFQEFADTGSIALIRWDDGVQRRTEVDARKIIAKGSQDDFFLKPGDVLVVP